MSRHGRGRKGRLRVRRTTGLAPGSLVINPDSPRPEMQLLGYNTDRWIELPLKDLSQLPELRKSWPVIWLNVDGLGDAHTLQELARQFELHPLAMEDVVNLHQRPKYEQYGTRHFVVSHMLQLKPHGLETGQLSLFLGPGFVITFQELPGWDCLNVVRERIRKAQPLIRRSGADYLAYSLLDAVVDHYFPILETLGDQLEEIEDRIVATGRQSEIAEVHHTKRELLLLRRIIWPLRDVFNTLAREHLPEITGETRLYLRDCYDHTVRLIDLTETYREICSDLMDLYLSSVSYRLNGVMKVLTIITTIFMPLSFIASIYGMNFEHMPELKSPWGYPAVLGVMAATGLAMLYFFKQKKWL